MVKWRMQTQGTVTIVDRARRHVAGKAARRSGLALLATALLVAALPATSRTGFASDLSGTWAALRVLSDIATFPLVGELERTSTLVQRVRIAEAGSTVAVHSTYCAATFDNGPTLTTDLDSAFVRSLGPVAASATRGSGDARAFFEQAWSTEVYGARLENPETDPLPTYAGDPRVVDQDTDGHPGITVRACAFGLITGDVYVVQRLRTRPVGEILSADRVEGRVEGSVEQVILGATDAVFLGTIASRPDPVAKNSFFVLSRIPDVWTCDDILARRSTLFGP